MSDLAVIMSVYRNDRLSFVKESVASILKQTFSDYHFYLVFDGPVLPEVEKYITEITDGRMHLYRIEINGGLAKALNFLLEIILKNPDYEFIARMDADDISLPERFVKQRDFLFMNPDISVMGCWYRKIDEAGRYMSAMELPLNHGDLVKLYYTRAPFVHPSVMFRKNLIERAGFYPVDAPLIEDNLLWGRALIAGLKFANIPEFLFDYRVDKDFFIRRSGITYGFNFIRRRIFINKALGFPVYSYILLLIIGIIKMMPSFILRLVYTLDGKVVKYFQ
jgi:glycosyltransferase involved in cell wall biosynthesis